MKRKGKTKMSLDDYLPVIVFFDNTQKEVYSGIASSVTQKEPVFVNAAHFFGYACYNDALLNARRKTMLAKRVNEVVDEQKSLIIGEQHCDIAFCYNQEDVSLVTFDAHTDFYSAEKSHYLFGNGSFLLERKGKSFVLGTDVNESNNQIKTYSARKMRNLDLQMLPEKIFLSLEADVYSPDVTTAHRFVHNSLRDKLCELTGRKIYVGFDESVNTSKRLMRGKNVVGINIAGYDPKLESSPRKTEQRMKQYLKEISDCV